MTFQLLDGAQAAEHTGELHEIYAEVYAGPPYLHDDDAAQFAHRFLVQRRQPGFALAEARSGGYLVGYATGMPLRPATSWWRELTTALPEDVTAEHPGRTFALTELLVRASWRRQGIGRALHDLVLSSRPEERATLTVLPTAPRRKAPSSGGAGARSPAPALPGKARPWPTSCSSTSRHPRCYAEPEAGGDWLNDPELTERTGLAGDAAGQAIRMEDHAGTAHGERQPTAARHRAKAAARPVPARCPRPDRHEHRLRHDLLRRLHGPAGRRVGQVVHGSHRGGRRRGHHDDRGDDPARRLAAPHPGGLP